ncbi:ABC transporter ATP-binding protein [Paramaledivibacter caminithermalis]|uniref:Bacitracin transport system ATP-binding protein n=1 Tax=Paramaledivibacter caminithermalis (strain DSM 15212 / CIP 107654 / DViRD3) TaxID=1121301 RepID=A0A1M6NNS2_PARC5|nr:ABC transporter ATP-binding protein [Paramaledivibacter caminithermalis]SHJ97369.1 bacitracin transport system ATP-binding protein [Paramaledivibacter caminithermalis DSM 15212]
MSIIIKTKNLTKYYGKLKAVDNVNLTVKKGEIYGFLGRNGAGKTTTIKMLLGLIKPTVGEIEIFGQNIRKEKRDILQRTGFVADFPGFYLNLSGVENLKINTSLLGVQKMNAIEDALNIVGIWEERNKLVKKYSLGMKQRLGIARSIIHNPELLIFDEPTNGLDPIGIKDTRRLIKSLAEKRKITIFISSHILSEIQQLANTIGIIHNGRLLEEISIEELRKKSRKYIEVQVSNAAKASILLERRLRVYDYEIHEENIIRVYSHYDMISKINRIFVENDIDVIMLRLREDNLEDYFIKLTGGDKVV